MKHALYLILTILFILPSMHALTQCSEVAEKVEQLKYENYYSIEPHINDSLFLKLRNCLSKKTSLTYSHKWIENIIGYLLNNKDDANSEVYSQAISLAEENVDHLALAKLYHITPRLYSLHTKYSKVELYEKSYESLKKGGIDDSAFGGRMLYNIGNNRAHANQKGWQHSFEEGIRITLRNNELKSGAYYTIYYAYRLSEKGFNDSATEQLEIAEKLIFDNNIKSLELEYFEAYLSIADQANKPLEEQDLIITKACSTCENYSEQNAEDCWSIMYTIFLKYADDGSVLKMSKTLDLMSRLTFRKLEYHNYIEYCLEGNLELRKGNLDKALLLAELAENQLTKDPYYNDLDYNYTRHLYLKEHIYDLKHDVANNIEVNTYLYNREKRLGNIVFSNTILSNMLATLVNNGEIELAQDLFTNDTLDTRSIGDYSFFRNKGIHEANKKNYLIAITNFEMAKEAATTDDLKLMLNIDIIKAQIATSAFGKANKTINETLELIDKNALATKADLFELKCLNSYETFKASNNQQWLDSFQNALESLRQTIDVMQDFNYSSNYTFQSLNHLASLRNDFLFANYKPDQKTDSLLFENISLTKSNELAAKRNQFKISKSNDTSLNNRYDSLTQELNYLIKKLEFTDDRDTLTEKLLQTQTELRHVKSSIEKTNKSYFFPKSTYEGIRKQTLLDYLNTTNSGYISFSQYDSTLTMFWATPLENGFKNYNVDKEKSLQWSESVRETLLNRQEPLFSDSLFISRLLPKEIVNSSISRLIISPSEEFGQIPFEVLPIDKTRHLSEKFDIIYSLEMSATLDSTYSSYDVNYLGLSPNYSESAVELTDRKDRWLFQSAPDLIASCLSFSDAKIHQPFSKSNKTHLLIQNANEGDIFRESPINILHFSGHGFNFNSDSELSGLVFTDAYKQVTDGNKDGILHSFEIYNSNIQSNLTILSACETGIGESKSGEGVMSLGRAFLASGSKSVLMSLWKVENETTIEIISDFLEQLKTGCMKSKALSIAKRNFMKNHPTAPPYYWSGFVLIGSDTPLFTQKKYDIKWLLALPLLLLLIGFIFRKKLFS